MSGFSSLHPSCFAHQNTSVCNLYKNMSFWAGGGTVVWQCVVLGGHWSSKFKLQCRDIWWDGLLSECQVVVLSIYLLLGWFSAFWVLFSIHSLLIFLGPSNYFHLKPLYGKKMKNEMFFFIIVWPFPIEGQPQMAYDTLLFTFTRHTICIHICL